MNDLLSDFVAKREQVGTKVLAETLGIKDSAVRMICTGHYPNPKPILDKFALHYVDIVMCPHAERAINRDECTQRSIAPKPFGGASKLAWWTACQQCEFKHKEGV
jgi:hypothetical protein